ncbi:hypothetical protein POM88_049451 [Heracleum sosnowskyi]|uniref:MULE transposase domain-containing protein n=1 Tax=Heracleum sosnowskyi TaxID=360622 RepID=A0AAD8GVL0_9APIA|nr:hypothetical protein POM88_049451 [Heracleum sosnowskyi]
MRGRLRITSETIDGGGGGPNLPERSEVPDYEVDSTYFTFKVNFEGQFDEKCERYIGGSLDLWLLIPEVNLSSDGLMPIETNHDVGMMMDLLIYTKLVVLYATIERERVIDEIREEVDCDLEDNMLEEHEAECNVEEDRLNFHGDTSNIDSSDAELLPSVKKKNRRARKPAVLDNDDHPPGMEEDLNRDGIYDSDDSYGAGGQNDAELMNEDAKLNEIGLDAESSEGIYDRSYTFISDRQKGLVNALEKHFPESEHRFCVMHLWNNISKEYNGKGVRGQLWAAC